MSFFWSPLQGSSFTLILTGFVLIFYYFVKNHGIPPGPWGFPYLGYWPFLKHEELHKQLEKLMKNYGDVYSFRITGKLYIHLGSIRAIKEFHLKNADSFRQRCKGFTMLNYVFRDGVACQSGESWKEVRKFFFSTFKEWGINIIKNPTSDPVTKSMESVIENLRKSNEEAVNIVDILTDHFSTMFHSLLFGNEAVNSEEIKKMTNSFKIVQTRLQGLRQLLTGNFTKYVILPLTAENSSFVAGSKYSASVLRKVVRRHVLTFNPNNIRNCVDSYLKERYDRREKGDSTGEYFTEEGLIYSLTQFTGDALLDVSLYPAYFLKALLVYPEEQDNIYKELMEVVGPNRTPTLVDKKDLPYTNAFLWEVTRISDFFPLFPSLECTRDTVINGYKIPKGSVTVMNMWAAQHDKEVYEDPYTFNPYRFFNKNGKDKECQPINYGVGKRACAGEAFAIQLMFLFVTAIVHNFKLSSPDKLTNEISVDSRELNVCFHARTHL